MCNRTQEVNGQNIGFFNWQHRKKEEQTLRKVVPEGSQITIIRSVEVFHIRQTSLQIFCRKLFLLNAMFLFNLKIFLS